VAGGRPPGERDHRVGRLRGPRREGKELQCRRDRVGRPHSRGLPQDASPQLRSVRRGPVFFAGQGADALRRGTVRHRRHGVRGHLGPPRPSPPGGEGGGAADPQPVVLPVPCGEVGDPEGAGGGARDGLPVPGRLLQPRGWAGRARLRRGEHGRLRERQAPGAGEDVRGGPPALRRGRGGRGGAHLARPERRRGDLSCAGPGHARLRREEPVPRRDHRALRRDRLLAGRRDRGGGAGAQACARGDAVVALHGKDERGGRPRPPRKTTRRSFVHWSWARATTSRRTGSPARSSGSPEGSTPRWSP